MSLYDEVLKSKTKQMCYLGIKEHNICALGQER